MMMLDTYFHRDIIVLGVMYGSNKDVTAHTANVSVVTVNQLSAQDVYLRRVASLVQRLGRVSSSPARIPLKYCNLLICLFTGVQ